MTTKECKTKERISVIYDGECPVCKNYLQILRIRETVADIQVINAREYHPIINEVNRRGFDLDNGMVVKIGEYFYYGSEAINKLALLSSSSGLFNKFNYLVFKSPTLSRFLYPVLVIGRSLLLKILGRRKIHNLRNDHQNK